MRNLLDLIISTFLIAGLLTGCSYTRHYALKTTNGKLCRDENITVTKDVKRGKVFSATRWMWTPEEVRLISQSGHYSEPIRRRPLGLIGGIIFSGITIPYDLITLPFKMKGDVSYRVEGAVPILVVNENNEPFTNHPVSLDSGRILPDESGCLYAEFKFTDNIFPKTITRKISFFENSNDLLSSAGEAYFAEPAQIEYKLVRDGKSFVVSDLPEKVVIKHVVDKKRKEEIRQEQMRQEREAKRRMEEWEKQKKEEERVRIEAEKWRDAERKRLLKSFSEYEKRIISYAIDNADAGFLAFLGQRSGICESVGCVAIIPGLPFSRKINALIYTLKWIENQWTDSYSLQYYGEGRAKEIARGKKILFLQQKLYLDYRLCEKIVELSEYY